MPKRLLLCALAALVATLMPARAAETQSLEAKVMPRIFQYEAVRAPGCDGTSLKIKRLKREESDYKSPMASALDRTKTQLFDEVYEVRGCKVPTRQYKAQIQTERQSDQVVVALVPGQTIADPFTAEVNAGALEQVMRNREHCTSPGLTLLDTRYVRGKLYAVGEHWEEDWTFAFCGKLYLGHIGYRYDGRSLEFMIARDSAGIEVLPAAR